MAELITVRLTLGEAKALITACALLSAEPEESRLTLEAADRAKNKVWDAMTPSQVRRAGG